MRRPRTTMSTTMSTEPQPATPAYLSVNNIEVIYDHVILVLKGVSLRGPPRARS